MKKRFQNTTISLSPNTQKEDVWVAFTTLCQPWKWHHGNAHEELERSFKTLFNSKHSMVFSCGRSCLHYILESLELDFDDEILMQSYTCVAVAGPILWNGLQPVYVDIDIKTLNMSPEDLEKKITPKSKVLIIQHTLGNPADLDKLIAIAKKHNLFIIEDCAHALGAKYNNNLVGTFGDVSFFSFGRDKVISSVFGGMVITNNTDLFQKLANIQRMSPSALWIIQQLLHPIIFALVKPFYTFFKIGKIILEISKRLHLTSKAVYPIEKLGGMNPFILYKYPNGLAIPALKQFKKLDILNTHRKNIANIYESELDSNHYQKIEAMNNSENMFLRFTILTKHAKKLTQHLKSENIYVGDWYTTSIAPLGVDYNKISYDIKTCPNAEKAATLTINLPTHIGISKQKAFFLAQRCNDILHKLSLKK